MIDIAAGRREAAPILLLVTAGGRPDLRTGVREALADLTDTRDTPAPPRYPAEYHEIMGRAREVVGSALRAADVRLVEAPSLADTGPLVTAALQGRSCRLVLLLVDAAGAGLSSDVFRPDNTRAIEDALGELAVVTEAESTTVQVYDDTAKYQVQPVSPYLLREMPAERWVLAADVACAVADLVETRQPSGPRAGGVHRTLGAALHAFLSSRAGSHWGLHSYTGSVVAGLIEDLERRAGASGNPVLRGPGEHGLACGALARWMLDGAPYLIVVTSGMVDEFKGTLANLRQAGARGFIVVAESYADRWYPFQGTVHPAEDTRKVLAAKGIPVVYLARAAELADDLDEAFAAYDAVPGPVVLLCTPSVLESAAPPPPMPGRAAAAAGSPASRPVTVTEESLTPVTRLLNEDPATLLWQVGPVGPVESDLLHLAARRSGAALADSLIRPGTVAAYRNGRPVPEYLGTLSLYGSTSRLQHYLYRDGRLRPRTEQCVFFLNSRITEAATPFSARVLDKQLRIVQVTHDAAHLAPFADHRIHADLAGFLRAVLDRLDVDEAVLAGRRAAIAAARDVPDALALLPIRPMSPNYFFRELNGVVEGLIRDEGYRYTGVYDVGRGGAAAVRNLVRTGPGFSGWYGRALMGDALQAVPAIALTRADNVLAFVGDGAAALVPDVLPTLIQQLCLEGHRLRGNLSLFRLCNGGHSIIRTYRETRHGMARGNQTTVVNLIDEDWTRSFGGVPVTHRRIDDVDRAALSQELRRAGAVNLYTVMLAHNNQGDGLSPLSAASWHQRPARRSPLGSSTMSTADQQEHW